MHNDIHVYLKIILDTYSELRTWYHLPLLCYSTSTYLWFCRFNKNVFFFFSNRCTVGHVDQHKSGVAGKFLLKTALIANLKLLEVDQTTSVLQKIKMWFFQGILHITHDNFLIFVNWPTVGEK